MRKTINIEINDDNISVLEKAISKKVYTSSKIIPLRKGIVSNGIIEDKHALRVLLKSEFKKLRFKSKNVHITFSDKLINIRRIEIDKDIKNIRQHIIDSYINTVSIIINAPVFDYIELGIEEEKRIVIFYAISNDILVNYYDFFKKMGKKVKSTEIFHNALFNPYRISKKEYEVNNVLLLKLEKNSVVSCVYVNAIPIFSINDEVNMVDKDTRTMELESIISKVNRYYKFNISHGIKEIERMVIYDNCGLSTAELKDLRDSVGFVEVFNKNNILGKYQGIVENDQLINLFSSLEGN